MNDKIILIAAHCKNRGIGYQNTIPWKCPEDMQHFKKVTTGHTVIMGRKTFESMGSKPLPNRKNIVVSTTMPETEGVTVCRNLAAALHKSKGERTFIMGGEQIYREALTKFEIDDAIITEIGVDVPWCDTFLPELPGEEFTMEGEIEAVSKVGDVKYTIRHYCRRQPVTAK